MDAPSTPAERNQAIYQARIQRRLEEHHRAVEDWRMNLRIVPMKHRQEAAESA